MSHYYAEDMLGDSRLIKSVGGSFLFHILLILFIYLFSSNTPDTNSITSEKIKELKVIQSAVKVDVVSMPKLTVKELKAIQHIPLVEEPNKETTKLIAEPVVEPKKEGGAKAEPEVKSQKNSFQSLLKTLSEEKIDLKNIKKIEKTDKIAKIEQNSELKKLVLEGNKISKGSQVFSENHSSEEQRQALELYAQNMTNKVRSHWSLPSYLLGKDFSCQVRVFISENGDLIKSEIYKKSADAEFDQRALRAVERTATFGVPDKSIVTRLIQGEVLLGFPL